MKLVLGLLGAFTLFNACAGAAPVGFQVDVFIGSVKGYTFPKYTYPVSTNTPVIRVTNTGGYNIDRFTLSIGLPDYNFDFVHRLSTTGDTRVSSVNLSDENNEPKGGRVREIDFHFARFSPGTYIQFQTDIDPTNVRLGWEQDVTKVLLGNGVATAYFSNGARTLGGTLGVAGGNQRSTSFQEEVPEPSTFALAGGALTIAVVIARRRQRVSART